ncbi:MAG TPA: NUDIX hydrolase [Anaerolineales bacterium]|nr:NUDIX hydrolase [Anaerolineales bacterium]
MNPDPVRFCPACGTPVQEREIFGRLRPVCPTCGRIHFYDPKVAVGVLVEDGGGILLVRRTQEPGRGRWTLPAGFVDAGEDPQAAAMRECREETGLEVEVEGLFDLAAGRTHPRGADIMIIYRARAVGGTLRAGDDADRASFFRPENLPELAFDSTRRTIERWRSGEPRDV